MPYAIRHNFSSDRVHDFSPKLYAFIWKKIPIPITGLKSEFIATTMVVFVNEDTFIDTGTTHHASMHERCRRKRTSCRYSDYSMSTRIRVYYLHEKIGRHIKKNNQATVSITSTTSEPPRTTSPYPNHTTKPFPRHRPPRAQPHTSSNPKPYNPPTHHPLPRDFPPKNLLPYLTYLPRKAQNHTTPPHPHPSPSIYLAHHPRHQRPSQLLYPSYPSPPLHPRPILLPTSPLNPKHPGHTSVPTHLEPSLNMHQMDTYVPKSHPSTVGTMKILSPHT